MGDLLGVHVLQAFYYLGEELAGVVLAEVAVLLEPPEQFTALAEAG